MSLQSHDNPQNDSPWPHRLAMAMVMVTFPLIWVGGLVTTYDAGMAVPDWPGTYGYNLFLYPLETWISGPWDLFIEHGHRLLGSLAGFLTILFNVAIWRTDSRRSMRWLAFMALLLVVGQGLLGGIRVIAAEREIAKIHGCVGPAFFAYCAGLAVLTSRRWRKITPRLQGWLAADETNRAQLQAVLRWSIVGLLLVYTQLFLGANLRHIAVVAAPSTYQLLITLHVSVAFFVLLQMTMLWNSTRRFRRAIGRRGTSSDQKGKTIDIQPFEQLRLFGLATFMWFLTLVQIGFGCGTWIVKFGWPGVLAESRWTAGFLPVAKSMLQANTVTIHVAIGSLLLALTCVMVFRSYRLLSHPRRESASTWLATGANT